MVYPTTSLFKPDRQRLGRLKPFRRCSIMADDSRTKPADTKINGPDAEPPAVSDRRDFLHGLGKWSAAAIAALLLSETTPDVKASGWVNSRGSWANAHLGGGGWYNRGASWLNGGVGGGWSIAVSVAVAGLIDAAGRRKSGVGMHPINFQLSFHVSFSSI